MRPTSTTVTAVTLGHLRLGTGSRRPSFMRQVPTRGLVGSLYAPGVRRTSETTGI